MNNDRIIDNRYEIIEMIGTGGMAIVYKAKCLVLNRYVAIKVLRSEYRSDDDFKKRFRAEAQAAGSLTHPNIVSIYDVAQDGDIDYIVMEYVEGVTLKQYVDAKGVIPWKEAIDYAAQICSGLECAHKKGIVHKDIKPHNIMITREGVLKITDFGIAKAISASTIVSNTTTLGTVHYFSPEQARGGYIDAKTDIYSLGVLLYEMVTGKLPFEGDSAISIAMKHIEQAPLPPREINPDLPVSFENVILKAMRKSPSARYESATRMLVDLKRVYIGADIPSDHNNVVTDETIEVPIFISKKTQMSTEEEQPKEGKKKKNENRHSKKSDILSVLAGIFTGILLIVILGYFFLFGPSSCSCLSSCNLFSCSDNSGEKIELPDFKDMTVEEAQNMVATTDIKIEVDHEERDDSKGDGVILSQDPEPGEMVDFDATIKVVINASKDQFSLISVENMDEQTAHQTLSSLGLNVSVRTEENDKIAKGCVIRQTPEPGSNVSKGGYVTIYVSAGKEESIVKVPNLINLSLEEAKSILLEEGLVWGSIIYIESDKPINTVIKQEIKPDKEVKEKTSIDLQVSRGPVTTPPPASTATPAPTNAPEQEAPPAVHTADPTETQE